MNEYVFEVKLRAVVRVRATDEKVARSVVPSVLGAPGSVEIGLANENNSAIGWEATVTEVDFKPENDPWPFQRGKAGALSKDAKAFAGRGSRSIQ